MQRHWDTDGYAASGCCAICSEECSMKQCQVGKSLEHYAKVFELHLESKSGVSS